MSLGFRCLFVITDPGPWCQKYDLEVFEAPCCQCGVPLIVDRPFIASDRRGLASGPCNCGNIQVPFSFINLSYTFVNLNSLSGR